MISNLFSENSCNKNHSERAAPDYKITLKNSGFNDNVTYIPSQSKLQTPRRQIISFNSPYSANVKTKLGKILMNSFHFPYRHDYYKLFNRNNIKLSYSCMTSIDNVFQNYNSKTMEDQSSTTIKTCNC